MVARGVNEQQGLVRVEAERIEAQAKVQAALQAATAAAFGRGPGAAPQQQQPPSVPAGTGVYSAVGFSYGGAGNSSSSDSSDDDSDGDDDDEDDPSGAGPSTEEDVAQEAEDERVDDIAEQFGLVDFSYRLHRALEKEGQEEARMRRRPRWERGRGTNKCCTKST